MKNKLLKFMADEGMSVDSMSKFERMYDSELQGAAKIEILNAAKAQTAAANEKIDVQKLADEVSFHKK